MSALLEPNAPGTASKAELLRSLGRLVRGLSALFWGLPIALIICVQTAKMDVLRSFNILPPLLVTTWLAYGLWQLGGFQRQERVWVRALDATKLLALVNLGLSPFLFWVNQRPEQRFFLVMSATLAVSGLLFLSSLNLSLYRLSAMLPDENLRQETRHFTSINRMLLLGILLIGILLALTMRFPQLLFPPLEILLSMGSGSLWVILFLALLPLAMTMALVWKIKETILDSVFTAQL